MHQYLISPKIDLDDAHIFSEQEKIRIRLVWPYVFPDTPRVSGK